MIDVLLISYASFACLALAMPRHHRQVFGHIARPEITMLLRGMGWLLCLSSLWLCLLQAESWFLGLVAWFGCLTGASIIFTLLLSYFPRTSAFLGGLAAVAGFIHTLVL